MSFFKQCSFFAFTLLSFASPLYGKEKAKVSTYGFVNLQTCFSKSHSAIAQSHELETSLKDLEKQMKILDEELQELSRLLQDQEYLDAHTPSAIEEQKEKVAHKRRDLEQLYMRHTYSKQEGERTIQQIVFEKIRQASERVAQQKNFDAIFAIEMVLFSSPELDVTDAVVQEMNAEEDKKSIGADS